LPESLKSPRRISSKKLSNLKVVVLCILAATTFWILNALNKDNYTTIVDYPVQWEFDRENYVPVKALPQSVQIQISGNGWDLLRKYFNLNEPPYTIILAEPSSKDYLLTSELKRPLGEFITPTKLESLLGDTIHFQVDRIVSKKFVPVLYSAGYSLAKNIAIEGKVSFNPNRIVLKGPSSLLDSLQGKFPVKINEKNIGAAFSKKVPLALDEKMGTLIQIEQPEVEVSFSIVRYLEGNKRLKIRKLNFPRQVDIEGEALIPMLSYLVDERKVGELKDMEFEALIDYRKRNRQDSTISLTLSPRPSYLKDIKIEPAQVKLNYE
jgi:hypothetical protein